MRKHHMDGILKFFHELPDNTWVTRGEMYHGMGRQNYTNFLPKIDSLIENKIIVVKRMRRDGKMRTWHRLTKDAYDEFLAELLLAPERPEPVITMEDRHTAHNARLRMSIEKLKKLGY